MDWQVFTTFLILAIAAGMVLRRLGRFLRSSRSGQCGGCSGCGHSATKGAPLSLVQLETTQDQQANEAFDPTGKGQSHPTSPGNMAAGAEKKR